MNVYLSRSIRTKRYKLIFNPHPEFAFTTHIDLLLRETSGDYFRQWLEESKKDPRAAAAVRRHHGRPELELYDLKKDPHEQVNLAGNPGVVEIQKKLLGRLKTWMQQQGDKLTVFHEPLMLDAPETWVPRK